MPSHFCGVFGLKPSFGRVPYYPVSTGDLTSHIGPMTRTVADSALMLEVMAGPHPLDYTTLEAGPADYPGRLHEGISGKRIAYSPDLGHARVDPDVAALVKAAVAALQRTRRDGRGSEDAMGRARTGDDPLLLGRAHDAPGAASGEVGSADGSRPRRLHQGMRRITRWPNTNSMRERKMAYIAAIHRWFEDWDFLLTPSVSVAAFPAEKLMPDHWPQHDWDWLSLGRVLLSVQHVLEPRSERAVRLHRRRSAGRLADRRPALRRSWRAAGIGGVRAGAALGGQAAGNRLTH